MDEAARRVNPVPLRALLRCRVMREAAALSELRRSLAASDLAAARLEAAREEAARHELARHAREREIAAAMLGHPQTVKQILSARDEIERQASRAVELADRREAAGLAVGEAGKMVAAGRAGFAARTRETQRWRATLDRVETARGQYAVLVEETELEDEQADRHARTRGPGT